MSQRTRVFIALAMVILLVGAILTLEGLRRSQPPAGKSAEEASLPPGSIPITFDDGFVGGFIPDDIEQLEKVSFVDPVEGKKQEGWLLADVLLLHLAIDTLEPDTKIIVSSSSKGKSVELIWSEVIDPANNVMLDLTNRGTLKLVSTLEMLDTRDEWIQDIDSIEVTSP